MARNSDILITAIAPTIWGSSYLVTTEFLPDGYPITVALLRGLPAGLLMMLLVRRLPTGLWWPKVFALGALNFSIFWSLMFFAAYRLPGGIAAIVVAIQPLIIIFLARLFLGSPMRTLSVVAAVTGLGGIALLSLTDQAVLDPIGIAAGLVGALSMASGTVLSRRWQPPVSLLTFTAWQLTAGGILLLPAALILEPPLPVLTTTNVLGFLYMGLIGGAITYVLWLRGIARLESAVIGPLGFLSPVTAVLLGWWYLGQSLTGWQIFAVIVVLGSIWLSQQRGLRLVRAVRQ